MKRFSITFLAAFLFVFTAVIVAEEAPWCEAEESTEELPFPPFCDDYSDPCCVYATVEYSNCVSAHMSALDSTCGYQTEWGFYHEYVNYCHNLALDYLPYNCYDHPSLCALYYQFHFESCMSAWNEWVELCKRDYENYVIPMLCYPVGVNAYAYCMGE